MFHNVALKWKLGQTNVGLLCCVGSGSNVAAAVGIRRSHWLHKRRILPLLKKELGQISEAANTDPVSRVLDSLIALYFWACFVPYGFKIEETSSPGRIKLFMRRDALKLQLHCRKTTHRLCQNECNGSDMTHAPCRIFCFVPWPNSALLSYHHVVPGKACVRLRNTMGRMGGGGFLTPALPSVCRRPTVGCPLPFFRCIGVNVWGRFHWPQPHNVP